MIKGKNTPVETKKFKQSLWALLLGGLFILASNIYINQWNRTGSQAVLSWDASGYYLYLPSIFYDDLGKLHNMPYILDNYNPSDQFDQATLLPNGNYVMKYSSGQAIMYFPGFVVGHLWAKAFGYPVDGFSMPYQCAVDLWSVLFGLIGLWYIRKLLLRYFNDGVVAFALLVLVFATNYYHYVSHAAVLTHNYLFTLYALILYHTDKWHEKPSYWRIALVGLISGLAVLTRPTEIICVLIPLLWGVGNKADVKEKIALLLNKWPMVLTYAIAAALIGSIQLFYWKHYSGHWLYYSYGGQSFSWLRPHILNGMFSYKKGWFMYTPIMMFALIGFVPLYRKWPKVFWAIFAFTLINIYICFAWDIWWYGGSFSQRSVVQSYTLLLFPLSAFIDFVWQRRVSLLAFVGVFLFCSWLNILMSYQPFMECDNMTRAYYWAIFGRMQVDPSVKRLLDTDELMPKQLEPSLRPFAYNNLQSEQQTTPCPYLGGKKLIMLDKDHQEREPVSFKFQALNQGWFRVHAKVFYKDKEWNQWHQTQLVVNLLQHGEGIKQRMIRIQRFTEPDEWQDVYLDISIPKGKEIDELDINPWNAGGDKTIWFHSYSIEYTATR